MNHGKYWPKIATPGLHLLAVLALLVTTVVGASAGPTAQELAEGGLWTMAIGATGAPVSDARFVVTTEDGDYIGECIIDDLGLTGTLQVCHVDVPSDRISLVWQDEDYLPAGYAPIENPIAFDPTVYESGPHNIGAYFQNEPVEAASQPSQQSEMKSMSIIPVEAGGSSVVGVGFSVTAEDGTFLGSCAVPPDFPGGYIPNCSVDVPQNTTVVIWFDPTSSSADLTPVEDPVYFDTSTEDNAQMWGPAFAFEPVGETASAPDASSGGSSSQPASAPVTDALSLLPAVGDVPGGLVETGRQTRTLPDVVANYTDAAETAQLFTQWGWEQNAIASFALPSNQQPQSGEVNGVYVSIHRFSNPDGGRAALDFSVAEQAAGTSLQEVDARPIGDYTRALFGPMDYGNEITLLTQQGGLLIRVSVAMLDGDPTAEAESIMQGIVQQAASPMESDTEVISPESSDSSTGVDSSQRTWTASVQVTNCDAARANCEAASGIVINISLASGEFLGSCTLGEPEMSPWGVAISVCGVPGLPYYEDFVATQDPTTIPAGYEPLEATLTLRVDGVHPGGGDQPTFGFTNVRTDTGSTAPSGVTSTSTGSATLLMTFRACPEGFDPAIGDYFAECTIPLDAPDAAFYYHGGDGQGGDSIIWLDRQYNGAYIFNAGPQTMSVELSGLAPVVRNAYQVIGADYADGSTYTVNLVDGETREVFVFYYYA